MKRKKVTIMMGIPGSGKSTLAKRLGGYIVSADNFHTRPDGTYLYNPVRAGQAHLWCLQKFLDALCVGLPHIIVDNTNTQNLERAPYVQLASLYGYDVELVHMTCDPELGAQRTIHGVPVEHVYAMYERFEEAPSRWPDPLDGTRLLDEFLLRDSLGEDTSSAPPTSPDPNDSCRIFSITINTNPLRVPEFMALGYNDIVESVGANPQTLPLVTWHVPATRQAGGLQPGDRLIPIDGMAIEVDATPHIGCQLFDYTTSLHEPPSPTSGNP